MPTIEALWRKFFGVAEETHDYSGRLIKWSSIKDQKSPFCPTIDHIRPLQNGGSSEEHNLIVCSILTNQEKADSFPTWNANGITFQAKRVKGKRGVYEIRGPKQ